MGDVICAKELTATSVVWSQSFVTVAIVRMIQDALLELMKDNEQLAHHCNITLIDVAATDGRIMVSMAKTCVYTDHILCSKVGAENVNEHILVCVTLCEDYGFYLCLRHLF